MSSIYSTPYHSDKDLNQFSFLVTGGAGFIGSNIVEYLLKWGAKKVRVLDNLVTGHLHNIEPFMQDERFEFIKGDIRNLEDCQKAVDGMEYVSHQAALGSVPRSIEDPITSNATNISGFLNMLVAVRDAGVKRMTYAASSSTYGDSLSLPKVEDKIGKPLSPYAVTKYVNELYADVFAKTYEGMELIGLRYFNIFGPKQDPNGAYAAVIPKFIGLMLEGKKPKINGDGLQSRDFTFVANAVQANVKALLTDNKKAVNEVYNIACGDRTNLIQLCDILRELSGLTDLTPDFGPARVGDVRDSLADISKASNAFDYKPAYDFNQGLELTYKWFKK